MYNFMLAFLICCVFYIIGEMVSDLTKAWVPSVFVSAVVMLLGYWTVFRSCYQCRIDPFWKYYLLLPAGSPYGNDHQYKTAG